MLAVVSCFHVHLDDLKFYLTEWWLVEDMEVGPDCNIAPFIVVVPPPPRFDGYHIVNGGANFVLVVDIDVGTVRFQHINYHAIHSVPS